MNNKEEQGKSDAPRSDEEFFESLYESVMDNPQAVQKLNEIRDEYDRDLQSAMERYKVLSEADLNTMDPDERSNYIIEKETLRKKCLEDTTLLMQEETERKSRQISRMKSMVEYQKKINLRLEVGHKVYPNDPCPCGSGRKYKNCCAKQM